MEYSVKIIITHTIKNTVKTPLSTSPNVKTTHSNLCISKRQKLLNIHRSGSAHNLLLAIFITSFLSVHFNPSYEPINMFLTTKWLQEVCLLINVWSPSECIHLLAHRGMYILHRNTSVYIPCSFTSSVTFPYHSSCEWGESGQHQILDVLSV